MLLFYNLIFILRQIPFFASLLKARRGEVGGAAAAASMAGDRFALYSAAAADKSGGRGGLLLSG